MKVYVRAVNGKVILLRKNLELQDKFGTTQENSSESLEAKEIVINHKLSVCDELKANNFEDAKELLKNVHLSGLTTSKLQSLKEKVENLIKCLLTNIIDVSLEHKKQMVDWTMKSSAVKSHSFTLENCSLKANLNEYDERMKSLESEIFFLNAQRSCQTTELEEYNEHLSSLISELDKLDDTESTGYGKGSAGSEEGLQRLKRDLPDEAKQVVQQPRREAVINTRFYNQNELPPGWLVCPAAGDNIGYIIPSKVPLGELLNDWIVPGRRYSMKQVIREQNILGRKLGLVIDLTNTTRYYQPSEWTREGIKHVKIACKGRDAVPDPESVNTFVYEVSQFSSRQKVAKKYILVHCTDGHNRTGFMTVHFLVRSQSMSVTEAIQIFHKARPPGIYKQEYIDALYESYNERKPEHVFCPSTPEWRLSSDLDLNGEAMPDDEDDGGIVTASQAKGNAQFPGSLAVSLNRENLQLLRRRYYYTTWKAEGTRYMMLVTSGGCFLINRNFNFRRVQMRFPMNQTKEGLQKDTHHLTLLDGEMVIDTLPDTQKKERRYLIYDLIAINSVSIIEWPFSERWKILENEVIGPRNLERQCISQSRNPYYRYDLEPFKVRRKDFWLLSTITKLLQGFIPKLSHGADGIIFQGWDDPYVPHTHEGLLKWKYPEMNSVDFLFEVIQNRQLLYLYERGKKKLMDGNHVDFKNGEDPSELSGKVIKCSWDSEKKVWSFMRLRVDKSTPNDINTYRKVMRSINDNITKEHWRDCSPANVC